jgi:hypothetical protein
MKQREPTSNALLLAANSLLLSALSANDPGRRKELEKKVSKIADLILVGLGKRS